LGTQPPEFYWFEAFEMIHKFTLTGFPLLTRLFSLESNTEAMWGTILAVIFAAFVNSVAPFVDDVDRRLSYCVQLHISIIMIAGLSNGHMEPHDDTDFLVSFVVMGPAIVLLAILIYGIIDPEYKTWFARKCVVAFRQLQSRATCCCAMSDKEPRIPQELASAALPISIAELHTRQHRVFLANHVAPHPREQSAAPRQERPTPRTALQEESHDLRD
jgi:hypothetical protein